MKEELAFALRFSKERKRVMESERLNNSGTPEKLQNFCEREVNAKKKPPAPPEGSPSSVCTSATTHTHSSERIESLGDPKKVQLGEMHISDSEESEGYSTDENFEADFGGKDLARVSEEADAALLEAAKMLEGLAT